MREIKLQAYILPGDPTEGSYVGGYIVDVITIDFENKYITWSEMYEISSFDGIKFRQFTGLLDKNGTEIYEGDIVYWEYKHPIKADLSEHKVYSGKFEVVIPQFYYDLGAEETTYEEGDDLEVIGNIYENPALLKEMQ